MASTINPMNRVVTSWSKPGCFSANQAATAANQAAASAQNAADAATSSGKPSVEQQLSDLKDMLDKRLITQQDYDAKKKELLGEM